MEIEVIVQSILPSDGPQGRYRIKISQDGTVEDLLRKTCAEAHVPFKDSYCLRYAANKLLSRKITLLAANIRNGEVLHWTDETHILTKTPQCNTLWVLFVLGLFIGITGLIAITIVKVDAPTVVFEYGIVIDAGSSHTSLYIYQWDGAKYKQTAIASQYGETCKMPGKGISSYAMNPSGLVPGFKYCLDKAKDIIPNDHWKKSPIYLGATAGMRLLNAVNPSQSNTILTTVRRTIEEYPFSFKNSTTQARILTGDEEGSFSWITSNYISKSFNVGPPGVDGDDSEEHKTIGALDMGGASAQITFIPDNNTLQPLDYSKSLQLYGDNYTLYTHSYLCYGINEALRKIQAAIVKNANYSLTVNDPCIPKDKTINYTVNYLFKAPCVHIDDDDDAQHPILESNETFEFVGESDAESCRQLVEENLFNFTQECDYSQCSFNGQYQPNVYGDFYAFSTFFYVTNFLNLTNGSRQFSLEEFENVTNIFCNKTWEQVADIPVTPQQKPALPHFCFEAQYILTLLTKGYKFNSQNWNTLRFVSKIEDTDIGWALGFMLNESNVLPIELPEVPIATVTFVLLIILFILFIVVAIVFACLANRANKHKKGGYSLFSNYGTI